MGSIPLGFIGAVWGHMLMELDLSFAPALKLDSGAKARRPRRD